MHLNTELLFKKYAAEHFKSGMKVLEIGPDIIPSSMQKFINDADIEWHTLNLDSGEATSRAKNSDLTILSKDEYNYPIADNTYDIVISANVMEHVKKIWTWLAELKRITKKDGRVITIAPVSWPYHEAPVDCWRIYPEGMKALYEEVGLNDEFTIFESLEKQVYADQPYTPLRSWASTPQNNWKIKGVKYYNFILSLIPHSRPIRAQISIAYDLISIARK